MQGLRWEMALALLKEMGRNLTETSGLAKS